MAQIEARGYANRVETKVLPSGKVKTTFSLGVKQKEKAYKDRPEKITWANFNVTDWRGGTIPEKSYVTLTGYLTVREYEKDGQKRQALEINATSIEVADSLGGSGGSKSGVEPTKDDPYADIPF